MEAKALHTLFGQTQIPPVASLKGSLGHTSGGGSLLELAAASRFLREGRLPGTVGFANPGVEEPLPLSSSAQNLTARSVLCLSAGFGGVNAAILLREHR
jgi:3-oxoacyl-(acyl-carrier-protein) synthase